MAIYCKYGAVVNTAFSIKYAILYKVLVCLFNTLGPWQYGRHFADDHFQMHFPKWNVWISITISQNSVRKFPINNTPALVQIMAWSRSGDKPLSEPMMVDSLTHVCVTRPQSFKTVAMLVLRLQNERPKAHKSMLKASQGISSHWSCLSVIFRFQHQQDHYLINQTSSDAIIKKSWFWFYI